MKATKTAIILSFLLFCIFSCENPTESEEKEAQADVNISWNQGSKYVYYSVFNTSEVTITNFYISIQVRYHRDDGLQFGTTRRFGNKDCEILPGKSYQRKFNASYQYGNATILSVVLVTYRLNPEYNWMYE